MFLVTYWQSRLRILKILKACKIQAAPRIQITLKRPKISVRNYTLLFICSTFLMWACVCACVCLFTNCWKSDGGIALKMCGSFTLRRLPILRMYTIHHQLNTASPYQFNRKRSALHPCEFHCSTSSNACMFDLWPTQGSWRRRWRIQRWRTSPRNRNTSSDTENSFCLVNWSLYLPHTSGTLMYTTIIQLKYLF